METRSRHAIAFTATEEDLVARIDFRRSHPNHTEGRSAYLGNQESILKLLSSLNERGAIPAQRISYWNDPEYNPGRLKGSRKQLFERNGNRGDEIYINPHFIRDFRYILFGADLPIGVIEAFEAELGDPQWVSFSDALNHGKYARKLVRQHGLDPSDACEEFYKLALDLGLWVETAWRIRQIVKETRL